MSATVNSIHYAASGTTEYLYQLALNDQNFAFSVPNWDIFNFVKFGNTVWHDLSLLLLIYAGTLSPVSSADAKATANKLQSGRVSATSQTTNKLAINLRHIIAQLPGHSQGTTLYSRGTCPIWPNLGILHHFWDVTIHLWINISTQKSQKLS